MAWHNLRESSSWAFHIPRVLVVVEDETISIDWHSCNLVVDLDRRLVVVLVEEAEDMVEEQSYHTAVVPFLAGVDMVVQRIAFVEEEMPWEDNRRPVMAVAVVAKDPLGYLVARLVLHFLVEAAAAEHTSSCLVVAAAVHHFGEVDREEVDP